MFTVKQILGKVAITVDKDYWSIYKCYDKLVIVEKENDKTYISRKPVPPLISITNRNYWIPLSPANGGQGDGITLVQELGLDEGVAVSQKAITEAINGLKSLIQNNNSDIFDDVINVQFSPNQIYYGQSTQVNITVSTVDENPAEKISVTIGSNKQNAVLTDSYTFTYTLSEDTDILVEVTKNNFVYSKTFKLLCIKSFYFGLGQDISDIIKVNNKNNTGSINISGEFDIVKEGNLPYAYLFLIFQDIMNFDKVEMNGFEIQMDEQSDTTVDGITYYVYKSHEKFDNAYYYSLIIK